MAKVRVDEVELFYRESGQGEPIVFHHAHAAAHDSWDEILEAIGDRYRCIALDARGVGESDRPDEPSTIETMAADVVGLADALGLEKFVYVGHSLGGVVGFELALRHPARLSKLVLEAPGPADGGTFPAALRDYLIRQWRDRDRASMIRDRQLGIARRHAHRLIEAGVDRALSASAGHYEGSLRALGAFRRRDELHAIQTPTLMIAGAADGLLEANLADFARLGNATLHVFSRVSHAIHREVPGEFTAVLLDFFEHGVVRAAPRA